MNKTTWIKYIAWYLVSNNYSKTTKFEFSPIILTSQIISGEKSNNKETKKNSQDFQNLHKMVKNMIHLFIALDSGIDIPTGITVTPLSEILTSQFWYFFTSM